MASPYIGEIRMFAGTFAPNGWALCNGQTMAISQNDTLFQLIGTTYGGDGVQTFNLPDLQGRIPVHAGQGNGLTNRVIGERSGTETVTVITQQMPIHTHPLVASGQLAIDATPDSTRLLSQASADIYNGNNATLVSLNPNSVSMAGSNQPHDNMMPFQAVTFIIALFGIFPSQN